MSFSCRLQKCFFLQGCLRWSHVSKKISIINIELHLNFHQVFFSGEPAPVIST